MMKITHRALRPRFIVRSLVGPAVAAALVTVSLCLPQGVLAQDDPASAEAEEAIARLKSPFCPGLMLEVCPTRSADSLREEIHEMAETGMEAEAIVDAVVAERGEVYRALPKTEGRGLIAWLAPPAALLLGLAGVLAVLRRSAAPAPAEADRVSAEEAARVRSALEELER